MKITKHIRNSIFCITGLVFLLNITLSGCAEKKESYSDTRQQLSQIKYISNTIGMPDTANTVMNYKYSDDRIYYQGYNPENYGDKYTTLIYDFNDMSAEYLSLENDMLNYCNHLLSADNAVYTESDTYVASVYTIEKYNKETGELIKSTEIKGFDESSEMYFDCSGNLCLLTSRHSSSGNELEIRRFNDNLEYIDLIALSDIFTNFKNRYNCIILTVDNMNVFCSQDQKGMAYIDICDEQFSSRYSYSVPNIGEDIRFVTGAGNSELWLFSCDTERHSTYADRINYENGNVIESITIPDIIPDYVFGKDNEYDFIFIEGSSISGYSLDKSEITELAKYSDETDAACIELSHNNNEIIILTYEYSDPTNVIYVTDLTGNLIDVLELNTTGDSYITDFFPIEEGIVIYSQSYDKSSITYKKENGDEYIFEYDSDQEPVCYYTDFHGNSYVVVYNNNNFELMKINKNASIDNKFNLCADEVKQIWTYNGNEIYLIYTANGGTRLGVFNTDANQIKDLNNPDDSFSMSDAVFIDGDDSSVFYITDYSSVYRYTGKEFIKTLELGYTDIEITGNIYVSDDSEIICLGTGEDTEYTLSRLYKIKVIDSDIKKNILNIISFGNCDENLEIEVKKYNSSSNTEYFNILCYKDGDWERLNNEIQKGLSPDIIVSGSCCTMTEFYRKNLALDLNENLNNSNCTITDNVISSCSLNGCLNYICPSYKICGVFKEKEVTDENFDWEFKDFTSYLNKRINYIKNETSVEDIMKNTVYSNINGYISSEKHYNFNSKEFTEYLDCLEGLKKLESNTENESFQYLEYREIGSFDEYNRCINSITNKEKCFKKIPGTNESLFLLYPDYLIGIFKSSAYTDESWKFIKTLLNDDYQISIAERKESFPATENGMKTTIENCSLNKSEYYVTVEETEVKIPVITKELTEDFCAVIKATDTLKTDDPVLTGIIEDELINIETEDNTKISAEIQRKAEIYLQESN